MIELGDMIRLKPGRTSYATYSNVSDVYKDNVPPDRDVIRSRDVCLVVGRQDLLYSTTTPLQSWFFVLADEGLCWIHEGSVSFVQDDR